MSIIKYQSRVRERTGDGTTVSLVYQGSHEEMHAMQAAHSINESSEDGRLKSIRIYQESPQIWNCELRYESDANGDYMNAPDTSYGKKSAQLKGSMLSMPLETHADYHTNWNYYLAAAPGVTAVPSWWAAATDTTIGDSDAQKYRWIKNPSECPADKKGMWRTLKDPVMPGVESYDIATYSVTESARFRNAKAAGSMVAGNLNKIGTPSESFGIRGGNWKCDDASVSWTGKYWLATLTWTKSGDSSGWNSKLYK